MKRIFCTLCAMTLLLYGVMTTAFATAVPSETPQGAKGWRRRRSPRLIRCRSIPPR